MGGDGGVVATNRRYMRGAGTADHTGDYDRHASQKFNAQEAMTTCALTKTPLFNGGASTVVADPYGQLYHKEAVVQALLKRKQNQQQQQQQDETSPDGSLGPQVRRLADLYDVRFHRENNSGNTATCPITGKALTGTIPAIVLVPGKENTPNVVSESALKQLSDDELKEEYGPIRKKIRLAPPPTLLESIKEHVRLEHEKEEEERKAKKAQKKKKRNRDDDDDKKASKTSSLARSSTTTTTNTVATATTVGKQIQSRVGSAIQKNSVLSSIFTTNDVSKNVTEKEKKDNLFAR